MVMLNANKARDDIEEILKRKEYQVYYDHPKGFIETCWDKAKEWIAAQLEKLFPSFQSASSASSAILIGMIVMVIMILAVAAYLLIRNVKRNRLLRNQKPLQSVKDRNWTFVQHIKEAERLESLEDYPGSTRHLFLAMLLFYHEKKWLEARIWKTNWDYFDELRKVNKQNADQFNELAQFFEDVTYGERNIRPEEFETFRTKIKNILAEGVGEGIS